jgi:hypothetical protein
MKLASVAIATSFVVTAGLVWYVNAANGYAFMRTASDVAVVVVLGVMPFFLALKKSASDTTDSGAWVFSGLSLAAGLVLLGALPSGDAVSFHSALLLAAAWGSYGLSRLLGSTKQNMEQ